MRVFVTGGTGLVGRRIVARLRERGDEVIVLSRSADAADKLPEGARVVVGDPCQSGPWLEDLAASDAVIHLAGEPIAGRRWRAAFKQRVRDSRVASTRLIAETLSESPLRDDGSPRVFACASAIGYYGADAVNATEFYENDLPGRGFLADVCVAWEQATELAAATGVRVCNIRVGIVLAPEGGVFAKMRRIFRWYLGGRIGGGRQWMSWIHVDDLAGIFLKAIDDPRASGPINGTAPEPVTNWGFTHMLANELRRPCWLPAPSFGLRLLLGEMAELATQGQRVIPAKAKELGYEFKFPMLEPAIHQLLGRATPEMNLGDGTQPPP